MSITQQLNEIITEWDINQTEFYKAWSKWELSHEALCAYASEYGNLIGVLSTGWQALGDYKQAQVEDDHFAIWERDFCTALNTTIQTVATQGVKDLLSDAQAMFSDRTQALWAMYAFIAQQASTSKAKIAGLQKYYDYWPAAERYFEEHLFADRLAEKLATMMIELSPRETKEVLDAAQKFAETLYHALDALYEQYHSLNT